MDIAITDGQIARVTTNISASSGERVVDATGIYITPALIDIHSHNYHGTVPGRAYSNSFNALPPDGFTFRAGVTTVVDVGGAGWRNFEHFKEQVIDRSQTRVLSFINITGEGMSGIHEQNLNDFDSDMTALVANRNRRHVVGVRSEEHTSEVQSRGHLVCRLLL